MLLSILHDFANIYLRITKIYIVHTKAIFFTKRFALYYDCSIFLGYLTYYFDSIKQIVEFPLIHDLKHLRKGL